ncbi:hypothetical protein [Photorhabdus temperata]|uniref:hypothetical protein n=1 Tax=Photorhabdus temperata TaxID=574560 RepID=UPI001FB183B6|nr:hypothetical protein [Photorhabdus temperata]
MPRAIAKRGQPSPREDSACPTLRDPRLCQNDSQRKIFLGNETLQLSQLLIRQPPYFRALDQCVSVQDEMVLADGRPTPNGPDKGHQEQMQNRFRILPTGIADHHSPPINQCRVNGFN